MPVAITRAVGPGLARCELTHLAREPIDLARAAAQHRAYEEALARLGCTLHSLPPDPDFPDSVFVEDVAVVLDEIAILTRPGAESRRGEVEAMAEVLGELREVVRVLPPATLEGGDVLRVGRTLFVGRSTRTSAEGAAQLRALVAPYGYTVREVRVGGCLHLKTGVSQVADETLLINRDWVDAGALSGLRLLDVDPTEPFAANALHIGDSVLHPAAHARTRRRLEAEGVRVVPLDFSELARAEAGVTCCSLVLRD